jgi:L-threonylcarbamoyladenylate synthase
MLLSPDSSSLNIAATAIKQGSLVSFPTDTYFALGADGMNNRAVQHVFEVKGRNPGTPVPLLISDLDMVTELATTFPQIVMDLASRFWPGALTIVVPALERVPESVTARTGTVGLRIPDHSLARQLIRLSGTPITGTSCNVTSQPPMANARDVDQQFGEKIDFCIESPCGSNTAPSTVISYANGKLSILRLGAISIESIKNTIGKNIVIGMVGNLASQ